MADVLPQCDNKSSQGQGEEAVPSKYTQSQTQSGFDYLTKGVNYFTSIIHLIGSCYMCLPDRQQGYDQVPPDRSINITINYNTTININEPGNNVQVGSGNVMRQVKAAEEPTDSDEYTRDE